ncbi:MAG: HEAT repeat domain-containing protein [Planctomycetaceae bacterium]|jgi:HEAT repeat protein
MKVSPAMFRRLFCVVVVCLAAGWYGVPADAQIQTDYLMFSDPDFPRAPMETSFSNRLAEVWSQALDRPEADLQRMAAESIARGAKMGVPGLNQTVARLRTLLVAEETHPAARAGAAKALVGLDARDVAESLATAATNYPGDVRRICERALGEWKYEPIRGTWQERLTAAGARHRDRVLAIRGLGLSGDPASVPQLLEIAHGVLQPAELRLEAALAAGRLKTDGLVADAQKLIDQKQGVSLVNRLAAARLLASHKQSDAHALLLKLAVDPEPAVAADALERLNDIDCNLVLPLAEQAMQNADHLVRRQGMRAYTTLPTPERMGPVSRLLDDLVPGLRQEVTAKFDKLLEQPELVPAIWKGTLEVLGQDSWRGQEQAALLVGQHRHQPAAQRLFELQSIPRAEARVAAAWALRRVAVPETLPRIFKRVDQLTKQRVSGPMLDGIDEQVAHLIEALAVMEFWQAEALWRLYIPKQPVMGHYSRGAAIWALGKRFNGTAQPELAQQLVERLTDTAPVPAEMEHVRYSSAVTLGRIKADTHVKRMIDWVGEPNLKSGNVVTPHALAVRWAVMQLTGDEYPELQPFPVGKGGWFLEPSQDPYTAKP